MSQADTGQAAGSVAFRLLGRTYWLTDEELASQKGSYLTEAAACAEPGQVINVRWAAASTAVLEVGAGGSGCGFACRPQQRPTQRSHVQVIVGYYRGVAAVQARPWVPACSYSSSLGLLRDRKVLLAAGPAHPAEDRRAARGAAQCSMAPGRARHRCTPVLGGAGGLRGSHVQAEVQPACKPATGRRQHLSGVHADAGRGAA